MSCCLSGHSVEAPYPWTGLYWLSCMECEMPASALPAPACQAVCPAGPQRLLGQLGCNCSLTWLGLALQVLFNLQKYQKLRRGELQPVVVDLGEEQHKLTTANEEAVPLSAASSPRSALAMRARNGSRRSSVDDGGGGQLAVAAYAHTPTQAQGVLSWPQERRAFVLHEDEEVAAAEAGPGEEPLLLQLPSSPSPGGSPGPGRPAGAVQPPTRESV